MDGIGGLGRLGLLKETELIEAATSLRGANDRALDG